MKADGIRRSRAGRLAGLVALALICFEAIAVLSQEASQARTAAPDWEQTDLHNKRVKFSDFRGHVLIVDFWATWCGACRPEISGFVDLQKQYGDKGLTVIGVSLDEQGADVVTKFVKRFGVNYPIVIGNEKVADAYGGIDAIPTTFVIDRQGRIVSQHIGYDDKSVFEKEIQSLL